MFAIMCLGIGELEIHGSRTEERNSMAYHALVFINLMIISSCICFIAKKVNLVKTFQKL